MPHFVQTMRGPNSFTRRSPGYLSTLTITLPAGKALHVERPDAILAQGAQRHRLDPLLEAGRRLF
jgi:hypothetical protein